MATRLQADADGKEAKWADIDDDEDDWAPETIEWNDGTKITLPQNDPITDDTEEQSALQAEKTRQAEEDKQRSSTSKASNIVGPNATVLRLGTKVPPKGATVVFKTPSEKPTLVAKPTAPPPAKSPWASLPPVDKVAPITINPPVQVQTMPFQRHESVSRNAESAPAAAAMEIAADSFTRTPRDSNNSGQGQLFNSQSGQYETVNANRRGSNKRDQNFRPPALLQRPSPSDKNGPSPSRAEISLLSRRTSIGGAEMQVSARRDPDTKSDVRLEDNSTTTVSSQHGNVALPSEMHGIGPSRAQSGAMPIQGPTRPYTLRKSVSNADALDHVNSPTFSNSTRSPLSNEVNAQRQLMQESIEKAKQRKQEEMQREEAARQERIKKKLEALGPLASREPGAQTDTKLAKPTESAPEILPNGLLNSQILPEAAPKSQREVPNGASGQVREVDSSLESFKPTAVGDHIPSKRSNEIQSYGTPLQSPAIDRTKFFEHRPVVNGVSSRNVDDRITSGTSELGGGPKVHSHKPQLWHTEGEAQSGWKSSGMGSQAAAVGSLWGPPGHQKGIGNGAFDQAIPRQTLRQSPFQDGQPTSSLSPIGPPRTGQPAMDVSENSKQLPFSRENTQGFSQQPPPVPTGQLQGNEKPLEGYKPMDGAARPPPPPQQQQHTGNAAGVKDNHSAALRAWGTFSVDTATVEWEQTRRANQEFAALSAEEKAKRLELPIMSETWRQIKAGQDNQRRLINVYKGDQPQEGITGSKLPEPSPSNNVPPMGPLMNAGRTSRFMPFMPSHYQVPIQQMGVMPVDAARSPSPPPPETILHPAFDRLHGLPKPRVNIPGAALQSTVDRTQHQDAMEFPLGSLTEKPKVRLPPAPAAAISAIPTSLSSSSPEYSETRTIPLRAASQPLVNNKAWQDRFNGLLGTSSKWTSPEKPVIAKLHAHAPPAITSTSKDPLEIPLPHVTAAVSLPAKDDDTTGVMPVEPCSILIEDEEALFENREFGSLPTVNLAPADTTWKQAKSSKGRKVNRAPAKEVVPLSKDIFDHPRSTIQGGYLIFINFKGMITPKSRIMYVPEALSGTNHDPRHRSHSVGQKSVRGLKPSGNHQPRQLPPGQPHFSPQSTDISPHVPSSGSRSFFGKRHGHGGHSHGNAPWNTGQRVASAAH